MVPCICRSYLFCVCHVLQKICELYPGKCIFIVKTDFEKYYCRINTYGDIAAEYITILGGVAHVLIRLPSGSTLAPSKWCVLY